MGHNFEKLLGNVARTTCEIGIACPQGGAARLRMEPAQKCREMQRPRLGGLCCLLPMSLHLSPGHHKPHTVRCSFIHVASTACSAPATYLPTSGRITPVLFPFTHQSFLILNRESPDCLPLHSSLLCIFSPFPRKDLPFCFVDGILCCAEGF